MQRAPIRFAADRSSRGLNAYVDEVRKVIEANQQVLPLMESILVFTGPDAVPGLAPVIPTVLRSNIDAVFRTSSGTNGNRKK